jgi:sulfotransferase family protein
VSRAATGSQPPHAPGRTSVNPYFFIVGAPRSGTRMLGRLVNAHPEIAVIHEARFVPGWFSHRRGLTPEGLVTPELAGLLAGFERFEQLAVEREQLERLIADREELPYSTFVSELFDLHGRAVGKRLVGDKSPRYVRNLRILHQLWPGARLVHLVRDGRDVGLSVLSWKKVVERGAPLGPGLYREVRYESLVEDPAAACESLCSFLDVPYDDGMVHRHEGRPPTPGMRKWRAQMAPEEVERFEAVAGDLLDELGYPCLFPEIGSEVRRHSTRMRELFSDYTRERGSRLPERW